MGCLEIVRPAGNQKNEFDTLLYRANLLGRFLRTENFTNMFVRSSQQERQISDMKTSIFSKHLLWFNFTRVFLFGQEPVHR